MDISKRLEEIEMLLKNQNILLKEFLTLDEAAEYLSLSKSAVYKMTSKKEIPFYNPGGKKIYFKRVELDSWILNGKVESASQIEIEIETYLSRK
jgi:excisionase family DNA binding protein